MSNLWINIRFGCWHLQIGPDHPRFRWSYNGFHKGRKSPPVAIYTLFGWCP
jgi:hypothetical protein